MQPPLGQLRYTVFKNPYGGSESKTCVGCGSVLVGGTDEGSVSGSGFGSRTGVILLLKKPCTLGNILKEPNS